MIYKSSAKTLIITLTSLLIAAINLNANTDDTELTYVRPVYSDINSLMINAVMSSDEYIIPTIVYKKGQDQIRFSAKNPLGQTAFTSLFKDNQLFNISGLESEPTIIKTTSDEAAAQLFDLLFLTPHYHFKRRDQNFNLNSDIFKNYKIEIITETISDEESEDERERIKGATLFSLDKDTGDKKPLRSVEILSYQTFNREIEEPQLLVFVDEETSETSQVEISDVNYNMGLVNFIFKKPKTTSDSVIQPSN